MLAADGLAQRTVALSGQAEVRFDFCARANSFEAGDTARIGYKFGNGAVVYPAGTPWNYTSAQSNLAYKCYQTVAIATGGAASVTIVFDANMTSTADYWYIDSLAIFAR